jgi:hypothetical protein
LLNIQNVSFSYKYFSIFVDRIVNVFSQSDVTSNFARKKRIKNKQKYND